MLAMVCALVKQCRGSSTGSTGKVSDYRNTGACTSYAVGTSARGLSTQRQEYLFQEKLIFVLLDHQNYLCTAALLPKNGEDLAITLNN